MNRYLTARQPVSFNAASTSSMRRMSASIKSADPSTPLTMPKFVAPPSPITAKALFPRDWILTLTLDSSYDTTGAPIARCDGSKRPSRIVHHFLSVRDLSNRNLRKRNVGTYWRSCKYQVGITAAKNGWRKHDPRSEQYRYPKCVRRARMSRRHGRILSRTGHRARRQSPHLPLLFGSCAAQFIL